MTEALLLALIPAVGTLVGGLLAIYARLSKRNLSFVLHVGAGVVLGVVGVELLPRALTVNPPHVILISFMAGSVTYVLLNGAADVIGKRWGAGQRGAVFGLVFGVGVDMLTDGMMIAAGQSIGGNLGLLLGVGLLVADSPEAFATIASVRTKLGRGSTIATAFAFPALVLLGVPLGYLLLGGGESQLMEYILLSFTAGVLVLVVVEGLIPEAHSLSRRQAGIAALLFSAAFTVFAALSLYLEGAPG